MDVLNTIGGGVDGVAILFAILLGIIALILIIGGLVEDEAAAVGFGLLFAVVAIFFATKIHEPVRHEVTLRPGHVIDATKYEIIEQRGQIYVIEEREVSGE